MRPGQRLLVGGRPVRLVCAGGGLVGPDGGLESRLSRDRPQRRQDEILGGVDGVTDAEPLLQVDEPQMLPAGSMVVRRAIASGPAAAIKLSGGRCYKVHRITAG